MAKEHKKVELEKNPEDKPSITVSTIDRSADAGQGFEHLDPSKDLKIPFIVVLQSGSPQLKRNDPAYIEGAQEGDLFNTATRKLYKVSEPDGKPMQIVVVDYQRVHNEWIKRSAGKGFVKAWADGSQPETQPGVDGQKKVKELVSDPTHMLAETVNFMIYVLDEEDGPYKAVLSMFGGNLGTARDLISKLFARKEKREDGSRYIPAMRSNAVELSTTLKKFTEGTSCIYVTNIVGQVVDEVYVEATEVFKEAKAQLQLMSSSAAELQDGAEPAKIDNKY